MSFGAVDHLWAGVRPQPSTFSKLEAYYNKFLHRIVHVQRREETLDAFVIRHNHEVSSWRMKAKIDVRFRYALRLVGFVEHMHRHKSSPQF